MVIVQLSGGLGNQMFEYALYLRLKADGRKVKIDDRTCYGHAGERPLQLTEVFGAAYDRALEKEIRQMTDSFLDPVSRIKRKLLGRKDLSYREAGVNFDPEVLQREPALLEGCFQSERYFAPVADEVKEAYRFRKERLRLSERTGKLAGQIEDSRAVSVHVRRGDYLDASHGGIYEGICTAEYYEKAMEQIRRTVPDAVFYVFSNDTAWALEHFTGKDCVVAEGGTEDDGYQDMYLMSLCEHHIIANSSFSWWAAWLGKNPEKIVIAPKKWLNGTDCRDIYTEKMIRI
ncbi:MAG TPA: alpha-1,2-fucosyltransferase [Candidatus Eisenbergiella merdipullorum]|uniref:Alpha-1,2-fucosyltransferase n=1 Tax=Candidatus Eisenbergiella merdipullorum TaxID=2838553 RepID=A0A9D2KZR9_9FIRM|nr:alpha-1,2-fucosyltransferase [Candidatus Eisenbergiella merdipullorum]